MRLRGPRLRLLPSSHWGGTYTVLAAPWAWLAHSPALEGEEKWDTVNGRSVAPERARVLCVVHLCCVFTCGGWSMCVWDILVVCAHVCVCMVCVVCLMCVCVACVGYVVCSMNMCARMVCMWGACMYVFDAVCMRVGRALKHSTQSTRGQPPLREPWPCSRG